MIQYPGFDKIAFEIGPIGGFGPLKVHWYGIMYLIAFTAGWWLARLRAKKPGSTWKASDVDDFMFFCMLGTIVGGRLGYVLFYGLSFWAKDPWYPIKVWDGGISFHGGLLGVLIGNIDAQWTDVLKPVPGIVIPFFACALGTGIDLADVAQGGLTGILLGVLITLLTGALVYLGYRFLLRRGKESGIGFAAGTASGNSVATPAIVAAADPSFSDYVGTATSQVAASVLVTAVLAPVVTTWVLRRAGAQPAQAEKEEEDRALASHTDEEGRS